MADVEEDILVDIADEDLPKLAKMYEDHKESAPHAYSTIMNGIEVKTKDSGKYLRFMSPKNCWKDDGTFFVVLEYYSYDIFIYTLDESGRNVYEALIKTRRLDTNERPRLFYAVHNTLYPAVLRAVKERKLEIVMEIPCYLYAVTKEEALKYETDCPPEVYIKELDASHAPTVSSVWPHRYENADKFIAMLMEMNTGYGVFLKSNNELVSWALISMMGQLSMVQTADHHKKKGYGSLISKYLSEKIARRGHNPLGTIVVENIVSQMMFEKLGFKNLGLATFALIR